MAGNLLHRALEGYARIKVLEAGLVELKVLLQAEREARNKELECMRARAEAAEAKLGERDDAHE